MQVMSGAWFPPDMMLAIQAKEFNLCFSWSESPSGAYWQTPAFAEEWLLLIGGVLRDGSPLSTEKLFCTLPQI